MLRFGSTQWHRVWELGAVGLVNKYQHNKCVEVFRKRTMNLAVQSSRPCMIPHKSTVWMTIYRKRESPLQKAFRKFTILLPCEVCNQRWCGFFWWSVLRGEGTHTCPIHIREWNFCLTKIHADHAKFPGGDVLHVVLLRCRFWSSPTAWCGNKANFEYVKGIGTVAGSTCSTSGSSKYSSKSKASYIHQYCTSDKPLSNRCAQFGSCKHL